MSAGDEHPPMADVDAMMRRYGVRFSDLTQEAGIWLCQLTVREFQALGELLAQVEEANR